MFSCLNHYPPPCLPPRSSKGHVRPSTHKSRRPNGRSERQRRPICGPKRRPKWLWSKPIGRRKSRCRSRCDWMRRPGCRPRSRCKCVKRRRGWQAHLEARERDGCQSKNWTWGRSQVSSVTSARRKEFLASGTR